MVYIYWRANRTFSINLQFKLKRHPVEIKEFAGYVFHRQGHAVYKGARRRVTQDILRWCLIVKFLVSFPFDVELG